LAVALHREQSFVQRFDMIGRYGQLPGKLGGRHRHTGSPQAFQNFFARRRKPCFFRHALTIDLTNLPSTLEFAPSTAIDCLDRTPGNRHFGAPRETAAQMAELVDAPGSGPGGGNTVEVRVLFWAPRLP